MYITGGNGVFLAGALANVTLTGRYEFVTYYTSDNTVFQNSISTLTVDLAQAYFSGSDIQNSSVIVNTDYVIISGITPVLPAGISRVKGKAVLDPSGNVVWDANDCQAWVTNLARYVPCSYDVATNTAQFDYLLWAGHVSQAGTNAPTIDQVNYNISGETPTFNYNTAGEYQIVFTGGKLISDNAVAYFSLIYDGENQGFVVVKGGDLNTAEIFCYKGGALTDDRLITAYIEIRLVYTLN